MSNKYQLALDNFWLVINCNAIPYDDVMGNDLLTLKELANKETPKKVIKLPYKDIYGNMWGDSKTYYYNGCPVCKNNVGIIANYCKHCGQKLDWKEN